MNKYIDADKLKAEIERRQEERQDVRDSASWENEYWPEGEFSTRDDEDDTILSIIASLQQEQPEVDLEKLGEIARHIIAVKQNVEDMRLNKDEWSLLERIGYPQKLNARK